MTPVNWNDNVKFGALPPLPKGFRVVQMDSGHYLGVDPNGNEVTAITVDRFDARRWTIAAARRIGESHDS